MQKDKVRVYVLARELNMESKDLLDLCQRANIDVKNQLSSLDPEQKDQIVELVRRGKTAPPSTASKAATPSQLPEPVGRVRDLNQARRPPVAQPGRPPEAPVVPAAEAKPAPAAPPAGAPDPVPEVAAAEMAPETPTVPPPIAPAAETGKPGEQPPGAPKPPASPAGRPAPAQPRVPPRLPSGQQRPMRDLGRPQRSGEGGRGPGGRGDRPRPAPNIRVAPHPTPRSKPAEPKKPEAPPSGARKIGEIPPDLLNKPITIHDLLKGPAKPGGPATAPEEVEDEEGADKSGKSKRAGGVFGRDKRHEARKQRAQERKGRSPDGSDTDVDVIDRPRHIDRLRRKRKIGPGTVPRKGNVPVETPITVRSLSEAMSVKANELLLKLMNHGVVNVNINSVLEPEAAEALAVDYGVELEVKRPPDAEEILLESLEKLDNPEELMQRAPVVTVMGHVDHGKTSLLDKVRKSNVVATEIGGITQSIRAWRVEHNGRPITFLDTPGHEAFTKMRARGANVTDIAVIVVAADDGVMPQTEEAISHARAAGVAIVVAINKVDLPNANVNRAQQQLYGLELIPDNMGGDVPFIHTSAATGKGIDELLEAILLVADYQIADKIKANPNKPARGTCLEASISEGEGVLATLLVREGTLHKGDVVLCGASYGRVRAMYSDLGLPIEEAGPSVPARITGLDAVPNADDPFVAVDGLTTARDIAGKRKQRVQEEALTPRAPLTLESLGAARIDELKVILKADVRGSVEAIKKELEKLRHEEVCVRVLHTGIGAINESDVVLALTSPQDTLIVGFNVVADDRAQALAEARGIQVREYNIIYNLTGDIRAALEGRLKPREEVVHLGRAVIRETFKISRVGTIAGCYVTQGTIERAAKVRVIRGGVVIYPPPDKTASLESLKRFKDDAREVQQGYECGLKIAGYDDVKVDDVIEAYRIEQVQRTL